MNSQLSSEEQKRRFNLLFSKVHDLQNRIECFPWKKTDELKQAVKDIQIRTDHLIDQFHHLKEHEDDYSYHLGIETELQALNSIYNAAHEKFD